MKVLVLCAAMLCTSAYAAPHAAPKHAQALHFARGATKLSVQGKLSGSQHRVYTLRMLAGQHLKISAAPTSKTVANSLVPLLFVTPPCGKFNGDKTATYAEDSSRAGVYRIEVGVNQMASNARNGGFTLKVEAY